MLFTFIWRCPHFRSHLIAHHSALLELNAKPSHQFHAIDSNGSPFLAGLELVCNDCENDDGADDDHLEIR